MLKTTILFPLLLALSLYEDARLFTRPRENWRAAALALKRLAAPGTCLLFLPADSLNLYLVFDKTLATHVCDAASLRHASRIVLAASPYAAPSKAIPPSFQELRSTGLRAPTVTIYRRK